LNPCGAWRKNSQAAAGEVENLGREVVRGVERDDHDRVELDVRPIHEGPGGEVPVAVDPPHVHSGRLVDPTLIRTREYESALTRQFSACPDGVQFGPLRPGIKLVEMRSFRDNARGPVVVRAVQRA